MSAPWKTVRVFISSTFRDMQAERDWLVRFFFPRLREELVKYRIHFVDVDLRWGVTSDQNALGVCREVIDECHPRFLCMLGGRYGWVPDGQDKSITADEIHYGVLGREAEKRGHAFFYFRDERATARMVEEGPGDFRETDGSDNARKLAALKKAITDAGLNPRIYGEAAQWDAAQQRLTGLEAFGNQVRADLFESLRNDKELAARFTTESTAPPDEFAEEADQMEAFIEERSQPEQFILGSREPLMRDLLAFATADGTPNIFVLTGDPGSGKSALLAHFCRHSTLNCPHGATDFSPSLESQHSTLLPHFIGASTGSTDLRRTLRRLCHELAPAAGNTEPLPLDIKDLITHFQKLLVEAAGGRRVILVFDALNQFDATDGAHWLNWLPRDLPPGVRIVASVIASTDGQPEHPTLAILRQRPGTRLEELKPLTEADTLAIIEGSLRRYAKRLSPEQLAALLAKPAGHLPLYVLTALEELRTLGTYEEITDRIRTLPGDARALFGWILTERLARDPGFRDREGRPCGAALVEKFAACLGVSRHGLSPAELTALLDPGDPLGNVAALLRLLRPYLMRRGELLDFYHGQFREAAEAAHLETPEKQRGAHQHLADYFTTCAKGTAEEWETDSVHGFDECVYQLIKARQYDQATGILSCFPFLLHKLRVGLSESVFEDYELICRELSPGVAKQLENWADFFHEKAYILRRGNEDWPAHKILLQLAIEYADDSPVTIAAEQWLAESRCDWVWLQRIPRLRHAYKNPCLSVLEGHTDAIDGALLLRDGRLVSWSWDKTLRVWSTQTGLCTATLTGHSEWVTGTLELDDDRLLSWSHDTTLRLWDTKTGECLSILSGHTGPLAGAIMLTDARLLSWSNDALRIWDSKSGTCLAILNGHTEGINGALELNSRRLLSWAQDNTLRLWDSQTFECLAIFEGHKEGSEGMLSGHPGGVNGALALPDGLLLSWAWDTTLRLWNSENGACLAILVGHGMPIKNAIKVSSGRLISWSWDNMLRSWDINNGRMLGKLEGHTDEINGARILNDGRLLSWAQDKTLRLWNNESLACLVTFTGHTGGVVGSVELCDGRLLSWSEDLTLRIWDTQAGTCLATFFGHTAQIKGATELVGEYLVSWSWDATIRIWNTKAEVHNPSRQALSPWTYGALMLADGRVLSWSAKGLYLWDSQYGTCVGFLKGHRLGNGNARVLTNGHLLSWGSETLQLWDIQGGRCLATLEGHTAYIRQVLELASCRILSCSDDQTLRLWDSNDGACLKIFGGHTGRVEGAHELADGCILSWAIDKTLRVWDGESGICGCILRGHSDSIGGALALKDGRLLSWADEVWAKDYVLRLWDRQSGNCVGTLNGHSGRINGALELANGPLLSWSFDNTLRLWDGHRSICLKVLEGHTDWVIGALAFGDDRLLSWSGDNTLRLWDANNGVCLEVVSENQALKTRPEWCYAREMGKNRSALASDSFLVSSLRSAELYFNRPGLDVIEWNADSEARSQCLKHDGTAVVTLADGHVCILKLYHGNRRVSLAAAKQILNSKKGGSK